MDVDRTAAANAIDAFLRALGRDPTNELDLQGTGARVANAYADELCSGYATDARALLESSAIVGASGGLVVVRDIHITLMCPHHLLPATGTASIAMQAGEKWVGFGALAALAFAHSRRLTLQERAGEAIVSDIEAVLRPTWVGCRLSLVHTCMVVRGERAVGSRVETIAMRGVSDEAVLARAHAALGLGQ